VTSARARIVYWNNIPAPYVVERFNEIARRGNVQLEAWFTSRSEPDRDWDVNEASWKFRYAYLSSRRAGLRLPHWQSLLARERPDLLVSLHAGPSYLGGWAYARRLGVRTAFRVLPTFDTWVRRHPAKELVKRWVFPRADGFKVPGPDGASAVTRYGVQEDRIHIVCQSIDVNRFREGRQRWYPERDRTRTDLGLIGCVFAYVGRLWEGKGVSHLLDAFSRLQRRGIDASLLLVGSGEDEPMYRAYCRSHAVRDVVFTGFVQQDELPRYYAAADVFVFPTLGDPHGLVVDEAMASGLPVISTYSAGDITCRLPDREAGLLIQPAAPEEMSEAMLMLALDSGLRVRMGERAAELASSRTHQRYAEDFERFVENTLASPRA
jgi:glycosyltransferase involved in cell wall biosynthesis